MSEKPLNTLSGIPMIGILLMATLAIPFLFIVHLIPVAIPWTIATFFCWFGFFIVQPNTAAVMQLFGDYKGTVRDEGLRWANPFLSKNNVSLRIRNFESSKLKVNDLEGSPIEIGAIVVWQVVDSAEAAFSVDSYENFVHVQSEAALRQSATSYPYDMHDNHTISLRSHTTEIAEHLQKEIQERLTSAGVEVLEARISHLAYAPEIAQAMLQRQQAGAIIAARSKIVEGAVSMVHMALDQLAEKGVVKLDEERKAQMVSNLLVVLCGERSTQPIINTGSIY
ncbi:MAG: SPFH domain-containing protein [Ahniella sp.]|nr:SPFH domain-containing protein [Ahniella sp.]